MKAVVLAAGKGTRMQPLTMTRSKGMIPIANKPVLAWTVEFLEFCDEILLVVSRSQQDILDYFSGNEKVKFIFQDKPLGTGHALLQAEGLVGGTFIAMYGDDLYGKEDIRKFGHLEAITMASKASDRPEIYGVLELRDGFVAGIEEKPEKPKSEFVNCGIFLFDERIFSALKRIPLSPRGEYELTDALKLLTQEGVKIREQTIETWIPLTFPWNILDANKYILDAYGSMIHPSAEIRPGAFIEHPVAIDEGSVIGPNCFIRKYSSIGKNCKVGQAVEIKNSIVMDSSFVSHLSYVGDTIVGRDCNVAAGTLFANLRLDEKNVKVEINDVRLDSGRRKLGAIVGDGVKFGTRVTVMPGKRIWPRLLIPACHVVEEDVKAELPLSKYSKNGKNGD